MSNEPTDFEYFEGVRTIQHEDGSHTFIHTTHEPYVEPLTPKQQAAVLGVTAAAVVGMLALPFGIVRLEEWADHRREVRAIKKRKKLEALKTEAPKKSD